jgi:hypothetical protein
MTGNQKIHFSRHHGLKVNQFDDGSTSRNCLMPENKLYVPWCALTGLTWDDTDRWPSGISRYAEVSGVIPMAFSFPAHAHG